MEKKWERYKKFWKIYKRGDKIQKDMKFCEKCMKNILKRYGKDMKKKMSTKKFKK